MVAYLDEVYKNNGSTIESKCVSYGCLDSSEYNTDYCYKNASVPLCKGGVTGYKYDPNKNKCVYSGKELPPCDKSLFAGHPDFTQIARTNCPICLYYEVNNK